MLFNNPVVWLLAALAAPCALLAMRYWQRALFVVFVLMVFEGALRKWVFPSAQAQIYLVKDAILVAVYLGFLLDSRIKNLPAPKGAGLIKAVLIAIFVFGCIEVLNPNSPSVLVGLAGLKSYFMYAPVAFILPYAIKSPEHLFGLIRRYLIMAIPVAVLGFLQIMAGPASPLNIYVSWTEDAPALLSYFGNTVEFVRTSGTFSYISGYTAFLSFIALLAIGYNMAQGWRVKNNIMPLLALTLVVGAMFTTGSRAPIYTLLATGPVILWLAAISRVLSAPTAMRLLVLIPVLGIVAVNLSPQAFQAFMERADSADSSYTLLRLFSPFYQTIGVLSDAPAFGLGIGTTQPAAVAIMGSEFPSWVSDELLVEDEMARVTVELGLIGLLLCYSLRFLVAAVALRSAMSFKASGFRSLGIVLAVHLAMGLVVPVILSATAGLYYWGALGLVLTMRRFEQFASTKFGKVLVRGTDQTTNLRPVMPIAGAARRRVF
jgi:hypothetical protein